MTKLESSGFIFGLLKAKINRKGTLKAGTKTLNSNPSEE
jgi:hypothetical protein